jgi:hypothetical protein
MLHVQKWTSARENCDMCNCSIRPGEVAFFVDGKLRNSSLWSLMCPGCFATRGERSLGIGLGQLYDGDTSELLKGGEENAD